MVRKTYKEGSRWVRENGTGDHSKSHRKSQRRLMLYKLHGSLDWTIDNGTSLDIWTLRKSSRGLNMVLSFSEHLYKLQYFAIRSLFLAYELRRWTLDSSTCHNLRGSYGFNDEHINGILQQSLRSGSDAQAPCCGRATIDGATTACDEKNRISQQLAADKDQIRTVKAIASERFPGKPSGEGLPVGPVPN